MIYTVLLAVLFGILEGITEWLPISSTGHLILLRHFLPVTYREEFFSLFEVVIQLFALCAVLWRFFPMLWPFSHKKSADERRGIYRLWGRVLIAALPAAVVGLLFGEAIETQLSSPAVIAAALIGYGVLFLCLFRHPSKHDKQGKDPAGITVKHALVVGLFQVLALLPGTSRSGTTILGGLFVGLNRETAALFSFFLGIPTMLGASALRVLGFLKSGTLLTAAEWLTLTIGCAVSFAVSLLVIDFLMSFVRRHSFAAFGIYRILLGAAVLVTLIF